jgi:hypothetical protein
VPPVAASVAEYATPDWPLASEAVVMESAATPTGEIVALNAFVAVNAVELESFIWTVMETAPAWVGVPLSRPVEEFRVTPAGKDPAATDQVYGAVPPAAVKVAEYATPTCPFGMEAVAIETEFGFAAATVTVSSFVAVCAVELESFT